MFICRWSHIPHIHNLVKEIKFEIKTTSPRIPLEAPYYLRYTTSLSYALNLKLGFKREFRPLASSLGCATFELIWCLHNSGGYLLPQVRASHGNVIRKNMHTHAMKNQHIRDTDPELACCAEELSLRFLPPFSKSMALELRNMIFCESTSCHLMTAKSGSRHFIACLIAS
uniref:Uncharacterized protein n=1 Tax=Glossina pallidipes TaxID=7398 RepID=A0A1A9ZJC6_GLOPL